MIWRYILDYDLGARTYGVSGHRCLAASTRSASETAIVTAEIAKPAEEPFKAPCWTTHDTLEFHASHANKQYLTTNLAPKKWGMFVVLSGSSLARARRRVQKTHLGIWGSAPAPRWEFRVFQQKFVSLSNISPVIRCNYITSTDTVWKYVFVKYVFENMYLKSMYTHTACSTFKANQVSIDIRPNGSFELGVWLEKNLYFWNLRETSFLVARV